MSFLIVGGDLLSIYFAKTLSDFGWKVSLVLPKSKTFSNEYMLFDKPILEKLGLDADSAYIRDYSFLELHNLTSNTHNFPSTINLFDIGYLKNNLIKDLDDSVKIYENSSFIDKNGDNNFVRVGDKGTLIKHKYVLNFTDFDLYTKMTKNNECITRSFSKVSCPETNDKVQLRFSSKSYGLVYPNDRFTSFIEFTGKNSNVELEAFIQKNSFKTIAKSVVKYPVYSQSINARQNNIFLCGKMLGLVNMLNYRSFEYEIGYAKIFKEYFNKVMTNNEQDYNSLVEKNFSVLKKYTKNGNFFWSQNDLDKNSLLEYYSPSISFTNFSSMFENMPFSKMKIKLFFS